MGNHRSEDFFYPGNAVHGEPDYGPMPWRKSMCLEQSLTNAPSYSATLVSAGQRMQILLPMLPATLIRLSKFCRTNWWKSPKFRKIRK